jgi:formate/nitrite transporter FocA (FNT family)
MELGRTEVVVSCWSCSEISQSQLLQECGEILIGNVIGSFFLAQKNPDMMPTTLRPWHQVLKEHQTSDESEKVSQQIQ